MKYSILFLFVFFSVLSTFSQEILSPIPSFGNANQPKRTKKDTVFVYTSDTLILPIIDDFSENHFQKYAQNFSGLGVKQIWYYSFLDLSNKKLNTKDFSFQFPKKYIYNSDKKTDSIISINVTAIKVKQADLSSYPVVYNEVSVYPNYTIYDTLNGSFPVDTIWNQNNDVKQDSILVIENILSDKNAYWLDSNAYRNDHYAINPWTIGVVTFDGLQSNGYPYSINTSIRGYGDYLTSKPINLNGLKISDSIYFSFLYQPQGFGDQPENLNMGSTSKHDSLCLQFYNPTLGKWISYWSSTVSEDPEIIKKEVRTFKKVHLKIADSTYLKNNFQFRFVNYGDLSGSLDHFHLDYVKFRKNSGYQDTLFKDFAFVYPVKSILKKYTSLPWSHFNNAKIKPISDSISISIRNGSNIDENNQDGNLKIYKNGMKINDLTLDGQKLSNGVVNFAPFTFYTSFYDFKDQINVPGDNLDSASVQIIANVSAPFLNLSSNDTSKYTQKFYDYYAYDDGSAEAAYGLKSAQASVSYRFNTLKSDSILGAYIYFLPSVNDKSKKQFSLTLWKDNNGIPGEIIYEDDDFSLHSPIYGSKRDEFIPYYFKDFQRIFVDTSFFIGMRQIDKDYLNVGFDRNTNTVCHIFYSLDKINWNKSQVDTIGSLMIRPIFVSNLNKKVDVEELYIDEIFQVYPNPASGNIFIHSKETEFHLLDLQGRELFKFENNSNGLDISNLTPGIYFIREMKSGTSQKIMIN